MRKPFFNSTLLTLAFTLLSLSIFGQNCAYDTTRPRFTYCPSNILIVSMDSFVVVNWREPIVTDNCSIPTLSLNYGYPSGSRFRTGVSQISYYARDAWYNYATCNFSVTVQSPCMTDTIRPNITNCPNNQVIVSLDSCAVARWTEPKISDNCGIPTLTSTHQSGTCFGRGTTEITYTGKDTRNNTSFCKFYVIVSNTPCETDTIKPVIKNCPQNITSTIYGDSCLMQYWEIPTVTDNCSVPSFVGSHQPGICFSMGTTPITYTATDASGNTATCRFSVTIDNPCVNDTVKPVIYYCPENRVVQTLDSTAYSYWYTPYAYDNCGTPIITTSHDSYFPFRVGVTPVTFTARDAKGNIGVCTFTVTVKHVLSLDPCSYDSIKPTLYNCPTNQVFTTFDTCVYVPLENVSAYDNCSGYLNVTRSHPNFTYFKVGTTTVTYTATDLAGNVGRCEATITVNRWTPTDTCQIDTIAPEFSNCPYSFVHQSLDSCTTVYWDVPTVTDNCGIPSVTATHRSGTCFTDGATQVIYKATDGKGNISTCLFTITINNPCLRDTIKPYFTYCPQNIVLNASDTCTAAYWNTPSVLDNCSTPSVINSHTSGMCFSIGSTTVTYTATDLNNNQGVCAFTVTAIDLCANDSIPPYFQSCPQNIILTTLDSCTRASWYPPYAYDNCGYPSVTSNFPSYSCFPIGSNKVTYTAKDRKNNIGTCEFTVTVIDICAGDTIKPYFTNCPQNIVLTSEDTAAYTYWNVPSAYDNCSTPSVISSHNYYGNFRLGTTNVVYTATDSKGNRGYCAFKVIVNNPCANDTIKPLLVNCPTNIVLTTTDLCATARWTPPLATDNCTTPSLISTHQSGICFPIGSTTVSYSATDAKSNKTYCTFKVTVSNPCFTDTIKPTLYNCPANIAKETLDSTIAITWKAPTALDNCSMTTITATKQPNSLFNIGTTTVTYTAYDSKNNKNTCSFAVTVKRLVTPCSNDTVKPVFTMCPANITVTTTTATAMANWTTPSATDNCSIPSVSGTFSIGATFPTGTTAVVYTAKDAKGNLNYCRFNITVVTNRTALVLDSTKCYALIARSSKKAVTVANASTVAGAYGVQWSYLNTLNQKWKIATADTNSFNLTGKQSNLNLDTRWGTTTEGTRLMQWGKSVTAMTQKWQFMLLTDGYYKVINKGSGRALSVSGGAGVTADGGILIQSTYTGLTSQQWTISEVPCTSSTANFATNDQLDLEAYPEFNRARIEWTDNTGYKNDYYEIQKLNQKSGEFERFEVVNNTSFSNTSSYQLCYDKTPMDGDNFYRVKVVYLDSLSHLSPVKKLVFNGLETIKLFPNPANDYVDIDLSKFGNETIDIYLYNSFGVQIAFKTVKKDKFSIAHFDISNQQNGNYLMRIVAQGKRDILRQLQIVK